MENKQIKVVEYDSLLAFGSGRFKLGHYGAYAKNSECQLYIIVYYLHSGIH